MVDTGGVTGVQMRGYELGVTGSFNSNPPHQCEPSRTSIGEQAEEARYAIEGTNTSSRRLFLRLQDAPLPFLEAPWMNFTHTLSCLNCTRNLPHKREHVKHRPEGGKLAWFVPPYSSEMSMLSSSLSAAVAPVRWSLVMISIRWSLLSKKSPLIAEADPWSQDRAKIVPKNSVWSRRMFTPSQLRQMVMSDAWKCAHGPVMLHRLRRYSQKYCCSTAILECLMFCGRKSVFQHLQNRPGKREPPKWN